MRKTQVSVFRELNEDKLQDAVNDYLDCIYDDGEGTSKVLEIKYTHCFVIDTDRDAGGDIFTAMIIYEE